MNCKNRRISLKKELLTIAAAAVLFRIVIGLLLVSRGYYYGDDPDTFWRLGLSWIWSRDPFFIFGYWTPLQFWLSGSTFRLLQPVITGATPLVPVVWNHVFFSLSATLTYLVARQIGGRRTGFLAFVIVVTMHTDILATFSGVADPILVACGVVFSYSLFSLFKQEIQRPQRFILLMAATAFIASATHYMGWVLVAGSLLVLAYASATKIFDTVTRLSVEWTVLATAFLVTVAFPTSWIVANYLKFGEPLRFLSQARAFHVDFVRQPLGTRAVASFKALWQAEPFLLLLALPAFVHQAIADRKTLVYSAPALLIFVSLFLSGIMGFVVPDLQPRYVLLLLWLIAPIVAKSIVDLSSASIRSSTIVLAGFSAVLVASGIVQALHFQNWMDRHSRNAASSIQARIDKSVEPLNIFIDPQSCLYPTAGIANSISRPDWVEPIYDPGRVSEVVEPGRYDLALAANPISVMAFSRTHTRIEEYGDYVLFGPGDDSSSNVIGRDLPGGWSPISESQILHVSEPGTMFFAFGDESEGTGSSVGIKKEIEVEPNGCYIISADIQDWYQDNDRPWVFLQQMVVNDVVLWSHDVGGEGSCRQRINHFLMPTSNTMQIEIRTFAFGQPNSPADWQSMSLTGVQNLEIKHCDPSISN